MCLLKLFVNSLPKKYPHRPKILDTVLMLLIFLNWVAKTPTEEEKGILITFFLLEYQKCTNKLKLSTTLLTFSRDLKPIKYLCFYVFHYNYSGLFSSVFIPKHDVSSFVYFFFFVNLKYCPRSTVPRLYIAPVGANILYLLIRWVHRSFTEWQFRFETICKHKFKKLLLRQGLEILWKEKYCGICIVLPQDDRLRLEFRNYNSLF